MKITCIGVGAAWDGEFPNNCHLVESETGTRMLLDLGYSIPRALWRYNLDPEFLDAIYISHPHADHYFGLPAFLGNLKRDNRQKPLTIICQKGVKEKIHQLIELGYAGYYKKLTSDETFPLEFIEVEAGNEISFHEFRLSFAPTIHGVPNLAVRISESSGENEKVLCYGGDGMFTPASEELFKDCSLLIHEGFAWNNEVEGHVSISKVIAMAQRAGVKKLAITHINRDYKNKEKTMINEKLHNIDLDVLIPKPLDVFEL
jgi:ribonuclease Z